MDYSRPTSKPEVVTEAHIVDIHDALCNLTGRVCLPPLETHMLIEWTTCEVPLSAVRFAFKRLHDRIKRAGCNPNIAFEQLERYLLEALDGGL